jgi:hypothetical protein
MKLLPQILVITLPYTVSAWILPSTLRAHRCTTLFASPEDAEQLRAQAKKLREEVASFEQEKNAVEQEELRQVEQEQAAARERRERYSAVVPILFTDGSTMEERCDFAPRWKDEKSSYITAVEADLPLGIILGESDIPGAVSIDEVAEESNGGKAGLKEGDLLRALTACRMEMSQPTWQLVVGGIGQPKTVRFMYSVDNRPFEEVMDAVASNRMDPEERQIVLVVERREND